MTDTASGVLGSDPRGVYCEELGNNTEEGETELCVEDGGVSSPFV